MHRKPSSENAELSALRAAGRIVAGTAPASMMTEQHLSPEIAERHGVTALLAFRTQQMNAAANPSQQAAIDSTRRSVALDLVMNRSTTRVLNEFASSGIPVLLLKGLPLAHLYYEHAYLRPRCDVDLFIPDSSRTEVAAMLENIGLRLFGQHRNPDRFKQFVATDHVFRAGVVHFDIHWKLSNRSLFANALPFDECWENRQTVSSLGPDAWTLSDIDLLLHACMHRIAHGRGIERNRMIWLYDIHLLWNALAENAKAAFVDKALAKKIGAVCADALEICNDLFGTIAADAAPTSIKPGVITTSGSGESRDSGPQAANAPRDWLTHLRQNRRHEPTARLIDAGKLRWALADLMATPGLNARLHYAKEMILKRQGSA